MKPPKGSGTYTLSEGCDPTLVGYATISTPDQGAALQLDAFDQAGCERDYVEKAFGAE